MAGPEKLHKAMSPGSTLKIRCTACGHQVELSRAEDACGSEEVAVFPHLQYLKRIPHKSRD
jgi:hypothetical protein